MPLRGLAEAGAHQMHRDQMNILHLAQVAIENVETEINQPFQLPTIEAGHADGDRPHGVGRFDSPQHVLRVAACADANNHVTSPPGSKGMTAARGHFQALQGGLAGVAHMDDLPLTRSKQGRGRDCRL